MQPYDAAWDSFPGREADSFHGIRHQPTVLFQTPRRPCCQRPRGSWSGARPAAGLAAHAKRPRPRVADGALAEDGKTGRRGGDAAPGGQPRSATGR
jgi:hypothetical protein